MGQSQENGMSVQGGPVARKSWKTTQDRESPEMGMKPANSGRGEEGPGRLGTGLKYGRGTRFLSLLKELPRPHAEWGLQGARGGQAGWRFPSHPNSLLLSGNQAKGAAPEKLPHG